MSHLNPLCFSNQIVFVSMWVFVCFTEIPLVLQTRQRQSVLFSVFFHHWQGHDLISNKMFSLCSIASHVCVAAAPRVFLVCTVLYTTIHLDLTSSFV